MTVDRKITTGSVNSYQNRQLDRPRSGDEGARARAETRWRHLQKQQAPGQEDPLDGTLGDVIRGIFGSSPFLTECLLGEPEVLRQLLSRGAHEAFAELLRQLAATDTDERPKLMAALRRQRRRWALLVALADLSGQWSLEEVTAALTAVADRAAQLAVDHLLREAARRGEIDLEVPGRPGEGSGIIVLAMGKHGAGELNYSSDIDLIVLFDDRRFRPAGGEPAMAHAVRLARGLAYILETKTADGYVFRTDLRLRPHLPGHPLALSTEAAELYYERHGQNWERAALIKARPVAGDLGAGFAFLRTLAPFIWRRHLDYAAIADIHSIKRQINAHRGFGRLKVQGHDLKVGRGGIREIEFFAQTQQLILGGRAPELRKTATCPALKALAQGRWTAWETADELIAAYRFLRSLEHRLQMVADRQTQALPAHEPELGRFAAFAGFADTAALETAVMATLTDVERHYAGLFEREADLGAGGSLVFTGTADDPDTLTTLATLGLKEPGQVSARIRAWHHGHIRATRSTRARELLTELTPAILAGIEAQPQRDATFKRFDEFLAGLPAGVQIFSLFRANPKLLRLVIDIMAIAPRLARLLSVRVDLLDAMLTPDFFEPLPAPEALAAELEQRLGDARDLEDTLELCRRWAHGRQFQAGIHLLLGLADGAGTGPSLTAVAEVALRTLLATARRWLVAQHGELEGGSFAVLALGKLGSRELSLGSDLDLVFIYDAPADARSTGAKPLPAASYYARLGQRLVSALAAKTAEGVLYEIDTRLRPSGNVGPAACSLSNFRDYQRHTAATWEQQALARARVVVGDSGLGREVAAVVAATLTRPRDRAALAAEIRAMRERIWREHGTERPWALKHTRGGIVELEFTAQFLVLAYAGENRALLTTATTEVLNEAAKAGVITAQLAGELGEAAVLYSSLQGVLRLSLDTRLDPATAPPRLLEALQAAAGVALGTGPLPDFASLEALLVETQHRVRQSFAALCGPDPAGPGEPRERAP